MTESKPAHRWLFLSIMVGILSGIVIIIQSKLLSTIIDQVYLHHATLHTLSLLLIGFCLLIFLRVGFSALREIISFNSAKTIKTNLREKCFAHLMTLAPNQLSALKTGELTSTLIEQIEALHGFFADYFPQMVITVVLPLIILITVFTQNWLAGLLLLITAPLIPLFMALIGMGTAKLNQDNFEALSRMSAYFLDLLQGLTTLSLFNQARAQFNTIQTISNDYREKTMRILRIAFLSTATLELFSTISIAIIAVYLGLGLLGFLKIGFSGVHITLAQALFILLLAPEFFMPLRQLGTFYHARAEAIGAATEIINILKTNSNTKKPSSPVLFSEKNILINMEEVDFAYSDNKKILDHFSLTAPQGSCIAITGPSGVGKSTLLQLIAKFIYPQSGAIFANGINIMDIDDDSWREHITLLHQQIRLFHGSIFDNITLANLNASKNEVELAAQLAGVLDFTQHLPQKLNTPIGEQNSGLSGGQAQRVALARIILKDTPIVLLDEPTSHLDNANASIILNLLGTWRGKKTVIIATHDQKIVEMVDHVYELKLLGEKN